MQVIFNSPVGLAQSINADTKRQVSRLLLHPDVILVHVVKRVKMARGAHEVVIGRLVTTPVGPLREEVPGTWYTVGARENVLDVPAKANRGYKCFKKMKVELLLA